MNFMRNSILNSVMFNRVRALSGALDELFYDFATDFGEYRIAHYALFQTVGRHVCLTGRQAYLRCIRAYIRAICAAAPDPPRDAPPRPPSLALVIYEAPRDAAAGASGESRR